MAFPRGQEPRALVSGADPPLRIGLNLLYLTKGSGGAGRYASELMRALSSTRPRHG